LLPYIPLEKYIYIFAPEMASRGNQHCASCIGAALSFPLAASDSLTGIMMAREGLLSTIGPTRSNAVAAADRRVPS